MSDEAYARKLILRNHEYVSVSVYEPTEIDANTLILGIGRHGDYQNIGMTLRQAKRLLKLLVEAIAVDDATFSRYENEPDATEVPND